jgi:hypothetical protein
MTSRESDIRVSANADDPCPLGVTGVSLDTCSTIVNASRSDISDRIYGTPVTYTVQDETLPPALQTSLDNCDDVEGACDYVSYDFDTGTSTQHDDLPYVINTRRTTVENSAIFIKKTEVQIYSVTGDGTTVTVTTTTPHEFEVGGIVTLSVTPFSGEFVIKSIPSPNSFTYESSQPCPSGFTLQGTTCSKIETYNKCPNLSDFINNACLLRSSTPQCPTLSWGVYTCPSNTVLDTSVSASQSYGCRNSSGSIVSMQPCYPTTPIQSCKTVGTEGASTRYRYAETSDICTDTLVVPVSTPVITSTSNVIYSPQPVTTFAAPPGYTYLSTAIGGTHITAKQQTSGASQTSCAQVCDDDSTCQGFNFSSLDETCELFSTIDATSNVATSKVSFRKGKLIDSLPFIPEYTIERAGRNCSNMSKCNEAITNLMNTIDLHTADLDHFKTTNIQACMYCPPRSLSYGTISIPMADGLPNFVNGYRIQNEYGYSSSATTKSAALDYLLYKDIGGTATHFTFRPTLSINFYMKSIKNFNSIITFQFERPVRNLPNIITSVIESPYNTYFSLKKDGNYISYADDYIWNGQQTRSQSSIFNFVPIDNITSGFYIQAILWNSNKTIKYYKYDGTNFVISDDGPAPVSEWYLTPEYVFVISSTCAAGTAIRYLDGTCQQCFPNKYCPAGTVFPNICPAGTISTTYGATSISQCQTCPRFQYCPEREPATYSYLSQTYVGCPPGTENLSTGATSEAACIPCKTGTTSTGYGQACCPTGYTFANGQCSGTVSCPSGFTYDSTLRTCVNNAQPNPVCPAGSTMGPSGLLCASSPLCPAGTSLTNTGGTITVEYCISTTTPVPACTQGIVQNANNQGQLGSATNGWRCFTETNVLTMCPANYTWESYDQASGFIMCSKGRHSQPCTINDIVASGGYCRTIEEETVYACPAGYIPDPRLDNNGQQIGLTTGQCVRDYGPPTCPTGTAAQMTSGLNCVAPMTCPDGTYLGSSWDSTTKCISLPTCPSGSTLDYNTGKCAVSLCPAGYTQSGTTCSKYMCPVGYTGPGDCAQCEAGYRWDGTRCEPCLNGGTGGGTASGSARACTCTGSYTGDRCEICPPGFGQSGSSCNACNTNGTQNSSVGGICVCKTGYTGITCGSCAPNYMKYGNDCIQCLNGGTLTNGSCSCPVGFSGRICSDCAAGYTGTTCQTCASSYTWDGTACVPCGIGASGGGAASGGARSCTCATGYTGALCDTCASTHHWNGKACTSCYNGGTGGGSASGAARMCACPSGYTGDRCMLCASTRTWNGSACVACPSYGTGGGAAFGTARACACGSAYSGTLCDTCVQNAVWNGSACYLCNNGSTAASGPASGAARTCTCTSSTYAGPTCCAAGRAGYPCTSCPPGQISRSTREYCIVPWRSSDFNSLTGMGEYFPGGTDYGIMCPVGTYCPEGINTSPIDCPAGSYCPDGFRKYLCAEGTYNPYTNALSCNPCSTSTGTYCPTGSTSANSMCPTGSYCPNNATRTLCPSHTYNSLTGQTLASACTSCPAGKQFLGTGGTSSSVCVACVSGTSSTAGNPCCPTGFTSANKQCTGSVACATGTLQTNATCSSTQVPTCQTSGDTYSAGNCIRTSATSCPANYTLTATTYTTSTPTCPRVYVAWNQPTILSSGKCKVSYDYVLQSCPTGYSAERSGTNTICTATPTCSSGTFDINTKLCNTPTSYACKNTQICTTATCLQGTFNTTYGVCAGSGPTCPVVSAAWNQPTISSGKCKVSYDYVLQSCPIGYSAESSGTNTICTATPTCSSGTSIDSASNLCTYPYASCSTGKVQCTGGQYYDSVNKRCIYGKAACPTSSYVLSGTTCTLST